MRITIGRKVTLMVGLSMMNGFPWVPLPLDTPLASVKFASQSMMMMPWSFKEVGSERSALVVPNKVMSPAVSKENIIIIDQILLVITYSPWISNEIMESVYLYFVRMGNPTLRTARPAHAHFRNPPGPPVLNHAEEQEGRRGMVDRETCGAGGIVLRPAMLAEHEGMAGPMVCGAGGIGSEEK